ncbi:hypothetical protein KR054_000888 [Drosophila jambulina]|nr:hypothetical protein KR054_000888 [Drosophila jambulina]
MGASNSKPQTVQIANPIQITRDVAERINQATAKNTQLGANLCEMCRQRGETGRDGSRDIANTSHHMAKEAREVQPVNVAKSWKKRSSEVEESQFDLSVKRVQELFPQPKQWSNEYESDIRKIELEVIHCYQRYPHETLQCSELANQYNRFVFGRQNAEVAKMKSEPADEFV